jgi:hypothetical protein
MATPRRAPRAVWAWIRSAPGTYVWLAILFVTTIIIRQMSPEFAHRVLEKRSTNIHYLQTSPIRVLISSALWIWGSGWFFYAVLYTVFHANAERWLGTWRWLSIAVIAHVGATYASEGVLLWAINHGDADESARYTLDYGVSYALAGVIAVLAYRMTKPWSRLWAIGVVLFYAYGVVKARDFTSIGHMAAVLIGLACYPIVAGRPKWDPIAWARRVTRMAQGDRRSV